jgi:hypothetical protein
MDLRAHLLAGHVIPAHPLALDEHLRLDERRQRALTRYAWPTTLATTPDS